MLLQDYQQDQAKYVRDTKLKDQFGRWWHCVVNNKTGQPQANPNPIDWEDPLRTPNSYISVALWPDGEPRTDEIFIDFPKWIADVELNLKHWEMAINVMGEKKFPLASPEDRDGWNENPHLTKEAGPKPWPTVEMLRKAQRGDKQLLGLDTVIQSKPDGTVTYKQFFQECRRDGMKMKDIGAAWTMHKANLKGGAEAETEEEEEGGGSD
jgi:hypothetical protein